MEEGYRCQAMTEEKKIALNLGCGSLCIGEYNGMHFVNVDLDPKYADYAKDSEFMQHDIRNGLLFPENSIEFINMSEVLEHLNLRDGIALLVECYRVLKPGKKVRISLPDADLLIESYLDSQMDKFAIDQPDLYKQVNSQMLKFGMILFGSLHEHGDTGHKMAYNIGALHEILFNIGFRNVEKSEFHPVYDTERARSHQLAVEGVKPQQ